MEQGGGVSELGFPKGTGKVTAGGGGVGGGHAFMHSSICS